MIGLIPAAGTGTRMGALTRTNHKGLLRIEGRTILEHAVDALGRGGVHELVIVTGHRSELVESAFRGRARFVHNSRYLTHGILGSFLAARDLVAGRPFLFTTADHFLAPHLVPAILRIPGDAVSLVQRKKAYDAEDSKIGFDAGGRVRFGKGIACTEACGEYCGMTVFSERGSWAFFAGLEARFDLLGPHGYVMDLLNVMGDRAGLTTPLVHCEERDRIEIDTVRDLSRARARAREILRTGGATR